MADDDTTSVTDKAGATRRVELIEASGDDNREALLTGVGLLTGLVLGRGSLQAAASGAEAFASALTHFVIVVLACVAGALVLGRVYASLIEPPADPMSGAEPPDQPQLDQPLDPVLNPPLGATLDESSALNQSPESPISPHVAD